MSYYEQPVCRTRDYHYKMTLYVYPVALCGENVQRGQPLVATAEDTSLFRLKNQTEQLVVALMMPYGGDCFVEMRIECDGQYCDCDEWWAEVDTVNKRMKNKGGWV